MWTWNMATYTESPIIGYCTGAHRRAGIAEWASIRLDERPCLKNINSDNNKNNARERKDGEGENGGRVNCACVCKQT